MSGAEALDRGRCRACPAPMLWALTVKGRKQPLDVDPDPEGNVRVVDGVAHVLSGLELEAARNAGEELRLPHHATCPEAKRFKRKGAKS